MRAAIPAGRLADRPDTARTCATSDRDTAAVAALLLSGVALPLVALAGTVDGRARTSVVECDVNTGQGTNAHVS
ncbi:hypothetical protein [Streptomyces sp. NPDC056255]|uniref:hypothetical protein n=1 Tax=Streptomyces sp. NPDC056255 TaxID=3345764 RepID=UPI0035D7BFE3